MSARRWTSKRDKSSGWHANVTIGRWQIGYHVYRHSGVLPDRWVFQPFAIYDRKRRAAVGADSE